MKCEKEYQSDICWEVSGPPMAKDQRYTLPLAAINGCPKEISIRTVAVIIDTKPTTYLYLFITKV